MSVLLTLTSCFPDLEFFWSIFPNYQYTNIMDMENAMLTYRNWQPRPDMPTVEMIYHFNQLQRDVREKRIDPFQYKVMLHPSQVQ